MDQSGTEDDKTWACPYPNCDWSPSGPVGSDGRLTRAVVRHEIKKHRSQHAEDNDIITTE